MVRKESVADIGVSCKRKSAYLLLCCFLLVGGCKSRPETGPSSLPGQIASGGAVSCLGRILPQGGTSTVSPYVPGGVTPVVDRISVHEGDHVNAGQPLAYLSSGPYLAQSVHSADAQVRLAQARLQRAKAAASPEEVSGARHEVERLEAQRDADARDVQRNRALLDKDFIARSQFDNMQTRLRQDEAALLQARDHLQDISKVRSEDVSIASAQVGAAEADLARARQDASSSIVRAPTDATVLRVLVHAGEPVGPQGIVELASTQDLGITAEVYEADISHVHPGQAATITADFLSSPLHGSVRSVGNVIERQQALSADDRQPADARIFKVQITVPNAHELARFVKGRVNVVFQP